MTLLTILAVGLSISASGMVVFYLVRVIAALRSITAKLANARLLLLTVASQTEPAGELIGGIGSNVAALDELVTGVARTLGISVGGTR